MRAVLTSLIGLSCWLLLGTMQLHAAGAPTKEEWRPLKEALDKDITIANLSISLTNENWSLSLWGKNITDEEYVANTFVLPSFSGYLVALGPRDSWGLTARYNF